MTQIPGRARCYAWLSGPYSTPPLLPPKAYDESRISNKKVALEALEKQFTTDEVLFGKKRDDLWRKYDLLVDKNVGANSSPEDLAMLAIWTHHCQLKELDKGWSLYHYIFGCCVARLGKMNGDRAKYALWKVAQDLYHTVPFFVRASEEIEEAGDDQDMLRASRPHPVKLQR